VVAHHCKSSRPVSRHSASCHYVKYATAIFTLPTTRVCAMRQVLIGIIFVCHLNRLFSFSTTAISHSVVSCWMLFLCCFCSYAPQRVQKVPKVLWLVVKSLGTHVNYGQTAGQIDQAGF